MDILELVNIKPTNGNRKKIAPWWYKKSFADNPYNYSNGIALLSLPYHKSSHDNNVQSLHSCYLTITLDHKKKINCVYKMSWKNFMNITTIRAIPFEKVLGGCLMSAFQATPQRFFTFFWSTLRSFFPITTMQKAG